MLRLDEKCALVTPENTVSPRRSHNHHNGARALCIPEPWVNPPVFGVTDTMSLSTILPLAMQRTRRTCRGVLPTCVTVWSLHILLMHDFEIK